MFWTFHLLQFQNTHNTKIWGTWIWLTAPYQGLSRLMVSRLLASLLLNPADLVLWLSQLFPFTLLVLWSSCKVVRPYSLYTAPYTSCQTYGHRQKIWLKAKSATKTAITHLTVFFSEVLQQNLQIYEGRERQMLLGCSCQALSLTPHIVFWWLSNAKESLESKDAPWWGCNCKSSRVLLQAGQLVLWYLNSDHFGAVSPQKLIQFIIEFSVED